MSLSRLVLRLVVLLATAVLMLPVVLALTAWWPWGQDSAQAWGLLGEMGRTVLPDYSFTTLLLCALVGLGVVAVGVPAALLVSLFEFRGRRTFTWALLLPLAMPAYVVAYGYTDFLQYSGPLQTALRQATGWQGRWFPEVRNVWGAAWVMTFCLYPYVYLLARTALRERAAHLMEAARLLGAPLGRRLREVALPLARPAIAAGVALALMETLADYGVSSYFGIQTFTAGIYKAWLAMDNRLAAAQLAALLLLLVLVLLALERRAQARMRFVARGARAGSAEARPVVLRGWRSGLAWVLCAMPLVMGFVAPVLFMLRPLWAQSWEMPWPRFALWAFNSLKLGLMTAVLAVGLAVLLAFLQRRHPSGLIRQAVALTALGYAVPGAVVVVGLLQPVAWLQALWPQSSAGYWVTATSLGLVWAYLVRFTAVALQSVQSGYARIPVSVDESARMLGASDGRVLRALHLPLLKGPAVAAALLVFVDVMKELPATLVLRPFNSDTLAVVTYQLARDERLGEAALPALALVLVGLIPVVMLSRTLRDAPESPR